MKLSDIYKKGNRKPLPSELIEAGFGVDVANKRAYSKASDGTIFEIGKEIEIVSAVPTTLNKLFAFDKTSKILYGMNNSNTIVELNTVTLGTY